MQIVACPECSDRVRIPWKAAESAEVQCPLCGAEFELRRVLSTLPPELIVLDAGSPALAAEDSSASPQFAFLEQAAPRKPKPARPALTPGATASQRTRNSNASGGVAWLAKVVGGGVAGLVIGQLILWWMPGQWHANQRDPLRIAKALPSSMQWLVPAALRTEGGAAREDTVVPDTSNSAVPGPLDPLRGLGADGAPPAPADSPRASPNRASSNNDPLDGLLEPATPAPVSQAAAETTAADAATSPPDAATVARETDAQSSVPEWWAPATPPVSFGEISGAVSRIERDLLAWSNRSAGLERTAKRELFERLYGSLALAGRLAAVAKNPEQGKIRRKLDEAVELASNFVADKESTAVLPVFASAWLAAFDEADSQSGAVLLAEVRSLEDAGDWTVAVVAWLDAQGEEAQATVLARSPGADRLVAGQRVLLAGAWLTHPADAITTLPPDLGQPLLLLGLAAPAP